MYDKNHYQILGLPSGIEAIQLSRKDITKAYRTRALELHPDKHPSDPDSKHKFQCLNASYEFLNDQKSRDLYNTYLLQKHEHLHRYFGRKFQSYAGEPQQSNAKRKKMSPESCTKATQKACAEKLCLNVSWDAGHRQCDYSVNRLTELFSRFGQVENVFRLLRSPTERRMTALVFTVVASKDETFSAIRRCTLGDPLTPLYVQHSFTPR